jgi:hypothetical protein
MNDAIYFTLAKLDSLKTGNLILKCRVLLEIAQFTWLNHKRDNNCFKLTSEQYMTGRLAEYFIKKHDCAKQLDFDSCKENDWDKRIKNSPVLPMTVDKMILSPIENLSNSHRTDTAKKGLNRRAKMLYTRPPLVAGRKGGKVCVCVTSKLIRFQLELYKMLAEYSKQRTKSAQYVSSLVQSRLKTEGELSLEICNLH